MVSHDTGDEAVAVGTRDDSLKRPFFRARTSERTPTCSVEFRRQAMARSSL
jgi:hypothetical protein